MRRIITRFLAIIPSMAIAIGLGMPGINALLVASQVVLSIVLPFVISPLLYCTSNKAIMSVRKTRMDSEMMMVDTTPEVTFSGTAAVDVPPPSPPSPPGELLQQQQLEPRDRDSSIAERAEVVTVVVVPVVDYSNNKFVIAVGFLSWLIIVAANVYVIVELGLGGRTS